MRSFSVVPDEPRDQLAIELIGSDQQLLMVINELLLNGPVKTFEVGVHLGSSGIGMPVSFVQASDLLIEVLHKLRPVIGKNGLKRIRKNISDDGGGKGIDLATLRKRGRDTRQNCRYELPEGNLTDGLPGGRHLMMNVKSTIAKVLERC